MLRLFAALATLAIVLAAPGAARASEKLTDNASRVVLKVDNAGHAVVSFTRAGRRMHPVVWGAVNARHPSQTVPQVKFKIDYSGGYMRLGRPLWRTIVNRCRRYDGPPLPFLVAACKAPDGSYWALQRFRRLLPNLGIAPWLRRQRARELHISHWTGEVARLDVYADWVMSVRWHEIFGRLTYRGHGVHGFRATRSGAPLDAYGRLIYLDVFNSALGRGWKRENSFLAGRPNGRFCYLFVPRDRYAGYPPGPRRPAANGERYRVTAGGPGVTPFVQRIIAGLPDFSRTNRDHLAIEAAMNPLKASLFGNTCWGN
ncbi:MAG: hypothetical protein M3327_13070 [Actinomycetota bacterium]|nr:hypothetical protein [Actinomycetota bacterium]